MIYVASVAIYRASTSQPEIWGPEISKRSNEKSYARIVAMQRRDFVDIEWRSATRPPRLDASAPQKINPPSLSYIGSFPRQLARHGALAQLIDIFISRIRLSDETSGLHPWHVMPKPRQAYESKVLVRRNFTFDNNAYR